jgi:hypothetical protein
MEKYSLNVLAEAKQEYTIQLINLLYSQIYIGLKSIYDAARTYCEKSNDKNVLKKFQQLLSYIPKWNTDRINDEYHRIMKASDCDWLEDLITAVFVSHTKVLTSIKVKNKNKKPIELNVPNGPYFIHKCYVESARNFWKKPYLFCHSFSNIELQRNLSDAENLIKDSIHESIRKQLPVKHILKEYLGNDFQDDDTEPDISSEMSTSMKDNLRKLVKHEIEQSLSKKSIDETTDTHSLIKLEELSDTEDLPLSNTDAQNIKTETVDNSTDAKTPVEQIGAGLTGTAEGTLEPVQVAEAQDTEVSQQKTSLIDLDEPKSKSEGIEIENEIKELIALQNNEPNETTVSLETSDGKDEIQQINEPTELTNTSVDTTKKIITLDIDKKDKLKVSDAVNNDATLYDDEFDNNVSDDKDNFSFFDDAAPF